MTDPTPLPFEVGNARRLDALRDYAILDTHPNRGSTTSSSWRA